MIGLKLHLLALTVLFALLSQTQPLHSSVEIGSISEVRGNAQVLRDKAYGAELQFDIQQMDDVRTEAGRVAIRFEDDSTVKLTEHSKLVIDEYIYDPDPSKSKMALKFASGTARFITGKFNNKSNISIRTPTADIAIRGTDFTCTVDELGRSLVILLPDENGLSSGEIIVSTGIGSVTLNKPYQATTVSVYESNPTKPITLDISLEFIDNLLIVNPPEEETTVAAFIPNVVFTEFTAAKRFVVYGAYSPFKSPFAEPSEADRKNTLELEPAPVFMSFAGTGVSTAVKAYLKSFDVVT